MNDTTTGFAEDMNIKNVVDETTYPSAELFVDACYEDYRRLQENYNRIYDKVYYALCLVGVVLTVIITTLNFQSIKLPIIGMTVGQVIVTCIEIVTLFVGILLVLISTILLLVLLQGKNVKVFDSLTVRENELYREKKVFAAVWLIGAYTDAVNDIKPVIKKKQQNYDRALTCLIVGIIFYAIAIALQKGGF